MSKISNSDNTKSKSDAANSNMTKISACLWFNNQAEEAAAFYTDIFPNSSITGTTTYTEVGQDQHGQTPGSVMTVTFDIDGFSFTGLNGGDYFTLNPSISFFVHCESIAETDRLWQELSRDGTVLMPLDAYPFSERYGWVQDRFGVSWQVIVSPASQQHRIVPSFLFVGDVCGKAEEAMRYYASVFSNAQVGDIARYGVEHAPNREGTVMYGEFQLEGQPFVSMDSAEDHAFTFTEAVSLIVDATTQDEIDAYWHALSAVPEAEQCGWLKDRYGVSWQIVPETEMNRVLQSADDAQKNRTLEAMFQMKKIDLAALRSG